MIVYKCVLYDENNNRTIEKINCVSESEVIEYANKNNFKVASIQKYDLRFWDKDKINYKELRILCNEMGILLESGCEITKIFEMLKSNSNKKLVKILNQVLNNIHNGNSISQSFQKTNKFSKFFVSMVKAGEISGNLDAVMGRLSEYYDKEYKLKSKIKSVLIYPVILIILSIIASIFMLVEMIPNFQMIFENNDTEPPFITNLLINLSAFLKNNYLILTIINVFIIIYLLYKIKTSKKIKIYIEKMQLKIPIIKNLIKIIITTKFSRAFYILNKSGIEITEAIEISSQVVDNHILYKEILNCKDSIIRGNSIGDSLKMVQAFPNLFLGMIEIGEENGCLDKTLLSINKFYEQELDNKIEYSMKLIEPVIIGIVAVIIGVIVISMLLPMFDAISSI